MIDFKNIIKKWIQILAKLLSIVPCRYIVFESLPDYADNTRAVFEEMVKRGLNKKYTFIWLCANPKTRISGTKCAYRKFMHVYYSMRAKCLISCNSFKPSYGSFQKSVYLCHGIPIKSLGTYKSPSGIDYVIGLSKETNTIQSRELNIDINKFVNLGYPRNDALFRKTHCDISKLWKSNYNKIIVWYPTFRQHNVSNIASASTNAIPIIHSVEYANRINEYAYNKNILIVIKPHFSQDISYIKKSNLSNIVFINDDFFNNKGISSYEFVGGCNALITDYSSIYFDYLLCNKQVAVVWEDIEEYRKNRGFAIDVDYYLKGAYKIYNIDDFISFIEAVSKDNDSLKDKRNEILDIIHQYNDDGSTVRVVDFIEKKCLS